MDKNTEKEYEDRLQIAFSLVEDLKDKVEGLQTQKVAPIWENTKMEFDKDGKVKKNPGGRPRAFENPKVLWEKAVEYFQWCDENPYFKNELVKGGKMAGKLISVPTVRPYTLGGLCTFMSTGTSTLHDYENREGFEEYSEIIKRIKEIIRTQKFEGASIGAFNPNIIAQDLGLANKIEHKGEVKTTESIIIYAGEEIKI